MVMDILAFDSLREAESSYLIAAGGGGGILVTRSLYRDGVRSPRSIDYVESLELDTEFSK